VHNFLSLEHFYVGGEEKLPTGTVNIRYHFDFDGGRPGAGGTGTLHINDKVVAEGRIGRTVPFLFSADETLDVGGDLAMPVTDDYPEGESNQFSGQINRVRIDLEEDDVSHLEPEELKYHRTLARQ
jgi:arylsulfatase